MPQSNLKLDSTQEKISILAQTYMQTGKYHCAESILLAFGETLQVPVDLKYVSGFGRGLGGTKCVCGAYNGSIVVLNLLYGADKRSLDPAGAKNTDAILEKAIHRFDEQWKQQHKFSCCRLLTKNVTWGSPEHFKHCIDLTRSAAGILWRLIAELENEQAPKSTN